MARKEQQPGKQSEVCFVAACGSLESAARMTTAPWRESSEDMGDPDFLKIG